MEMRAADFSRRVAAYLIDTLPFAVCAAASLWAAFTVLNVEPTPRAVALLLSAWMTLLFGYQWLGGAEGATIGKRLLGLRVVTLDGEVPGMARGFIRAGVWVIGNAGAHFGFLVALCNRRTRALHDYASGTVVVSQASGRFNRGGALFGAAALSVMFLIGGQLYWSWSRPTVRDRLALAKARAGLTAIARAQDEYFKKHGVYASSIDALAAESGDVEGFKGSMKNIFDLGRFVMEAGNHGWRIRAAALDRRGTEIKRSGP